MATQLQRVVIGNKTIWIEAAEATATGSRYEATATKDSGGKVSEWVQSMDIAPTLGAVIEPVREALKDLAPGEVTIEFSVGFKAEVGFFLAKGETNGALKITAKWSELRR